jgi:hypothetical protein
MWDRKVSGSSLDYLLMEVVHHYRVEDDGPPLQASGRERQIARSRPPARSGRDPPASQCRRRRWKQSATGWGSS